MIRKAHVANKKPDPNYLSQDLLRCVVVILASLARPIALLKANAAPSLARLAPSLARRRTMLVRALVPGRIIMPSASRALPVAELVANRLVLLTLPAPACAVLARR